MFWIPLPYGPVKINFDALWNGGEAKLGFIVRDHYDIVLWAASIKSHATFVLEAEL